jgi:hypothetical protein
MNEELLNLLARLREPGDNPLTDTELEQLLTGLREHADELRDTDRTDEVVTALQETATAVRDVRAEQTTRTEAAAERDRQAEEALAQIAETDETPADETPADETPADEQPTGETETPAEGETPAETEAETTAEPIAASTRPSLGTVRPSAANRPRGRENDRRPSLRAKATITASGDLPGISSGNEITDERALATAMAKKLRAMGPKGGSVLVASITTEFPEERMLRAGDPDGNEKKYQDAISPAALAASGGICGPVTVDYSIPTFATTERPVKAALVEFGAERGGLTFTPPPTIGDVTGAVGIWTEATDADPQSNVKAKAAIACGEPTTVLVDAITAILEFGNMQGRFQPELVQANTQNALAYAARVAEINLLNKIHALSTEVTLTPSVGAGRGLLEILGQAIAGIRYRMRLSDQARFRVILPIWFLDMIMVDFAKELPSGTDRLAISRQMVEDYCGARNTTVSWALDGVAAQGAGNTYPAQTFAAQSAGALTAWPSKVVFPIFPEGSFQLLNGGEINLGVVRDSTLNSTNDYQVFSEFFENVAFRGIESDWVIATVAPTGASSGTVTPANP